MSEPIINPSGVVPIVQTVIADVNTVATDINTVSKAIGNTTSSVRTIVLIIALVGALFALLFGKGCIHLPSIQVAPTIVNGVTNVQVNPDSVSYTANNKKVTVKKPFESSPTINNGKLVIPHFGLCFEPKLSCSFTIADQLRPYLSARLIYLDNAGIELGVNDKRIFLGPDYRLPVLNDITVDIGASIGYTDLSVSPYAGLSIFLAQ